MFLMSNKMKPLHLKLTPKNILIKLQLFLTSRKQKDATKLGLIKTVQKLNDNIVCDQIIRQTSLLRRAVRAHSN